MGTPTAQVGADVAFGGVSTADLGFLLGAVVSMPGAADDPSAGSLAGSLLAALVGRGDDDVVERYLEPGSPVATFELRTYRVGSSVPVTRDEKVGGRDALQRMLDQDEPQGGHELVAHLEDGTVARVVVRLGDGPLVYQFAGRHGTAAALAEPDRGAPVADLADAVRRALADTTIEVDLSGIEEVVTRAVAGVLGPGAPTPALLPPSTQAIASPEEIAAAVSQELKAAVDARVEALVRTRRPLEQGEVLTERLWLKIRAISYQLRATGDALARVEAAVEQADPPATLRAAPLAEVVRREVEGLRAQTARLAAALSRLDEGGGFVSSLAPAGGDQHGDHSGPGLPGPHRSGGDAGEDTGPVPLAIVSDNARR